MNTNEKQSRNGRLLTAGLVLLSASALMAVGQRASAQTVAPPTTISTAVNSIPAATTNSATSEDRPDEPSETAAADGASPDVPTANLWGVTTQLKLEPETVADSADGKTQAAVTDSSTPAGTEATNSELTNTVSTADAQPVDQLAPASTTTATNVPTSTSDTATKQVATTPTTAATTTSPATAATDTSSQPVTQQSKTDINLAGEPSTPNVGVNPTLPTDLTVANVGTSTDTAVNPSMKNPIYNLVTDATSFGAALLLYPLVASRQMTQVVSWVRTLLSPGRYDISTTWKPLADTYDPANTQAFYTAAQDWYDNDVVKEKWSVPTADGKGQVSGVYLKNGDAKKTVIYGQGWTTEPQWMGYVSKVFYDMGYNVLMTYTQGQSASSGEFITFGAKDGADWSNWIKKVNEVNGSTGDIVLYGQSLGADVALQAAAQPNLPSNVKAVIADAGFTTLPSLFYSLYSGAATTLNGLTSKIGWHLNGQIPFLPFDKLVQNLNRINKFFTGVTLDDASGLTAVSRSTLPTLFISTTDDSFIPTAQTQALYNQSSATLKRLWVLTSAVGGHASATNAVTDYQAHVAAFMKAVDAMNSGQTIQQATDQTLAA
ncbi:cell surface hydrolase [Secundilactobacillus kimchicus JCM 15530]|uniref:Cell surface hydrolase n=1 Tax=Secundilactobacillus kimchicus JCM 15530 TaxID=1302272 RepID=A0A0R1HKM1_9LACO|nr:CocE/NonD family hydrolase [Secundilactobacillus kimchicus]KRK46923.1 cell surface hydrolase [Secundilactobacillus kimchicus JCM 15530]